MATELEAQLSLSPNEVAAALQELGLASESGAALAGLAATPGGEPLAGLSESSRNALAAALALLCRGGLAPAFRRGRRARPGYQGFLVPADEPAEATLALLEDGGALDLYVGLTSAQLLDWLLAPFASFRVPEIPLPALEPVPPETMVVLLALADLFRKRYPDPDPEWAPDGNLTFDEAELAAIATEPEPYHSLRAAWETVGGPSLPLLDGGAVSHELLVLALWQWLGKGEPLDAIDEEALTPADAPDSYWLPPALLWWVRCLAWWNHLLAIGTDGDGIAVIQATALWRIVPEEDEEGRPELSLHVIVPAELHHAVEEALLAVWPVQAADGPACPHCGAAVRPGARFCQACGQAVQPGRCPSCGGEVREGAAFCNQCGQRLGA